MSARNIAYLLTGLVVALIVVGGIVAIASSGGGDDSPGTGTSASAAPRVAGELRLFGADPITLDPACASDADSATYIVEIFSGLVTFDKDLKVIGDIADHWEVSTDGKVYTFHLRTNVLFHDGSRRVTADDFKYSMERAINPDTQSTVGDVYLDDIAGVDDYITGKATSVSGIKVIDPNTLELTLNTPDAVFIDKMTYPTAFVVDKNQVKDSTCFDSSWTLNANGTGPFKLKQWDLGQQILLVQNSDYYLTPKPSLQQVTFLLSGGSSYTMYQNDELDVTGIGANDIESVKDTTNPLNKEYHTSDSLDVFYIGFNTKKAPFDDPDVRRALAMAIDKSTLANDILKGLVLPADGILPPTMPGFNSGLQSEKFDPTAAKALLDSTGKADQLADVKLLTSGQGAAPQDALQAITAMWQQNLGVTIEIQQEDFGLFLKDIDDGNNQMFTLGWIADYPDPQNFLEINFRSDSGNNQTGYSNAQVDQLLKAADAETDAAKRLQDYQQAEQLIVTDEPWIPLYHGHSSFLVKPKVQGFEVPPFVLPYLRFVSITS
ncbi:MAG: peptide ABC transporter substrate-binding protein [Chloroflexota bacterium]